MIEASRLPHPAPLSGHSYSAVELLPDNDAVVLLDQRRLPGQERYVLLNTAEEVARAIAEMLVRGAPAIGIAAAYAMVLGARRDPDRLPAIAELLISTRPTAVNLRWAVEQMLERAAQLGGSGRGELVCCLAEQARAIHRQDVASCRKMGELGAERIPESATVLTHCNAGALATGGHGTALGVIRAACRAGKRLRVLADETRPYLQGARLTAWELARDGIPVEVIPDSSAAWFMARGEVDLVVVGADRIARNGDVANKIGTYALACLCHLHQRPFYVVAPLSTFDPGCPDGGSIPIEQRPVRELVEFCGERLVPEGAGARNPAFDVTPARLVTALVTDHGLAEPVGPESVGALLEQHRMGRLALETREPGARRKAD